MHDYTETTDILFAFGWWAMFFVVVILVPSIIEVAVANRRKRGGRK